jgi:hypothetical protein
LEVFFGTDFLTTFFFLRTTFFLIPTYFIKSPTELLILLRTLLFFGDFLTDFLTGDFLTTDFLTGDFLAGDFLTGDFLTGDFLTGDFLTGDFLTDLESDDFLVEGLDSDEIVAPILYIYYKQYKNINFNNKN